MRSTPEASVRRRPGRAALLGALLLAALAPLAGCQDGAGTAAGEGRLLVSLTDDPGDFAAYAVRVTGLHLHRADGAVVQALAEPVTVDFAQYVELTELLTAATVPAGTYTRAVLTLDYRDADIQVEDPSGEVVPVARVVDTAGEPVESLELRVRLEGRHALTVVPGLPAHLALDFDLNASHEVRFDPEGPTVQVEPFLAAQVEAEAPKPHRVRGALGRVLPEEGRFQLLLRPFHRPVAPGHRPFGRMEVLVDEGTAYEIDGRSYQGEEGLRALAALPALTTPVVAVGRLRPHPLRYVAEEVYAGGSVPGGDLGVVRGHVLARQGDRVTVAGMRVLRDGSLAFHVVVQVDLSDPALRVLRQGGGCGPEAPCDARTVSVGQRIAAFGRWDPDGAVLRASRIRLLVTIARGVVLDPAEAPEPPVTPLVLRLQGFGHLPAARFDFRGTGDLPAHDADPAACEAATGALEPPPAGTPVQLRGFVHPFGEAPPDFDTVALVDLGDVAARYRARWEPPSADALTAAAEALTVADEEAAAAALWRGAPAPAWPMTATPRCSSPPPTAKASSSSGRPAPWCSTPTSPPSPRPSPGGSPTAPGWRASAPAAAPARTPPGTPPCRSPGWPCACAERRGPGGAAPAGPSPAGTGAEARGLNISGRGSPAGVSESRPAQATRGGDRP